jgi:hypothetical protein
VNRKKDVDAGPETAAARSTVTVNHDESPAPAAAKPRRGQEILPPGFDYAALPAKDAESLRATAERIRQSYQRQCAEIVATGLELLDAKGKLRYGQFSRWLAAEFSWSHKTAQNYMNVALVFRNRMEALTIVPLQSLYRLAAPTTSEEVREELLTRAQAGEKITPDMVAEAVKGAPKGSRKNGSDEADVQGKPVLTLIEASSPPQQPEGGRAARCADRLAMSLGPDFGSLQATVRDMTPSEWLEVREFLIARMA